SEYDHLVEMTRLNEIMPPRASIAAEDPWASDPRAQIFLQAASMGTSFNGGAPGFEHIVHDVVSPTLQSIIFQGESINLLADAANRIESIIQEELSRSE